MARVVTSISVFIASPSDVQSERKTVSSVITEWNTRYGRERNINFEVLKWENFSAGFGLDGQDVINSHLGNDYDVLIALFWARFGTPTPRATSGTNEEFGRAVDRFRSKGNVEIAALFKDAPIDFRTVDLEQVELVKQFEQEAQNAGAYTKTFRDADGLRFEVGILLDSVARKIFQNGAEYITESPSSTLSVSTSVLTPELLEEDDIGLFDAVENLQAHAKEGGVFLDGMSSLLDNINLITTQENDKFAAVRRVRSLEPSDIKPSLEIISINMDSFSQYLEKGTPGFAESISVMANNIGAMVRTSYDFVDNEEDVLSIIWPFRTQVSSIFNAMGSSNQKTKSLVETISSLPRATSTFNKSRRRLVSNLDYLISVTDSARALFGQALDEIGRLITYIEGKAFKNKQ